MLWEDGKASANMKNYAWLVNTGHNTVKTVSGQAKTIIHLTARYGKSIMISKIGMDWKALKTERF